MGAGLWRWSAPWPPSAPLGPPRLELSQIHRDSQACLRPEPAIPSALAPNAVNGFSELPNRQLPPVLAASCSSGRPPRPAAALASLLAAEQAARVSELFVGRPARSLLVSQPQTALHPGPPAASTPQPASIRGRWPGPGSGPPSPGRGTGQHC